MSVSAESMQELEEKKNFLNEESARALGAQGKFYEAAKKLEEINISEDENGLGLYLLLAESYVQLGRESKGTKSIKSVKKILASPPFANVEDVINLAEGMKGNTYIVRRMILLRIASEIYQKLNLKPDEIVEGIQRCINLCRDPINDAIENKQSKKADPMQNLLKNAAEGDVTGLLAPLEQLKSLLDPSEMLKNLSGSGNVLQSLQGLDPSKASSSKQLLKELAEGNTSSETTALDQGSRLRVIILDFGIEYMEEKLHELKSVTGADPEKLALKYAWSCNTIGFLLGNLRDFPKSQKVRERGLKEMDSQFDTRAANYRIYGILLHNIGICLHNAGKLIEAEKFYLRTMEARESALDYVDSNEKQQEIERTRKALQNTRRSLK